MEKKENTRRGKALLIAAGQILGIGLVAGAALIIGTEKGMKKLSEKLAVTEKPKA